ncbi:hypothetical protein LY78DRAFT_307037 [Colletotrichum sublineola]|uniref:Uncharacterized protein n=1 Tax=Colletotrichum sublineola TaxID=1173701 RepID=A0A066X2K3_COLSU|nr:hypothetical protein LY78DRAFT_307037 [Colletotrichum sublineola]KDN63378.1 hypothetical protein CSUB01_06597 [Colletotrichum sublineola]
MDTQGPSVSVARPAGKAGTAGDLSCYKTSNYSQDEPIIESQPTLHTQGSLAYGHKQQGDRFADLETCSFDDKNYDLVNNNNDFFPEDEGHDRYHHSDHEGEADVSHNQVSEMECDDFQKFLDFLEEDVPRLILTTSEGKTILRDGIPEGEKCQFSEEYHALQSQWLKNLENYLIPGDWKLIRDSKRPQEAKFYNAEEKALRERRLHLEEQKRKRQRRRQSADATDSVDRARQRWIKETKRRLQ